MSTDHTDFLRWKCEQLTKRLRTERSWKTKFKQERDEARRLLNWHREQWELLRNPTITTSDHKEA